MAANNVTITLTAKDGASQTFTKVGREAEQMGTKVDQAAKKSSSGFDKLGKSAVAVGAGIGPLAGGIALAGQAALTNEQSMRALERSYGESTDQMGAMTGGTQGKTPF